IPATDGNVGRVKRSLKRCFGIGALNGALGGQEIGPHRQRLRAQGHRIEGDWRRACRWRGDAQWFADVELHAEVRRVEQREERTPRVLQRQLPREEIVHELEPLDLHAAQFATRYLALLVTGS